MDLQKLRARLKAAGLTQSDVAARLGRAHSQVSRMLSGKTRMRVDTLAEIEALLSEREGQRERGVAETSAPFEPRSLIPFITLEEAKRGGRRRARMTPEERERWLREIKELGEMTSRLPRVTDMTDDEILGYDEMP